MGFNLPHKANVGEIVRAKGFPNTLFLVTEFTEELSHDGSGEIEELVLYTCHNIDNHKQIKIISDDDILSIVVTAENSDSFIAQRSGGALPPAIRKKDEERDAFDILAKFQEGLKAKPKPSGSKANNAPRSRWAKEREEKRKAYEYIDFLLERHIDLVSMQQVMPHDESLQAEIDLVKAEFLAKSGEKVVQDGKFS